MKAMTWMAAPAFVCAVTLTAAAQTGSSDRQATGTASSSADKVTLTGCLQADANKTTFWLSDASKSSDHAGGHTGAAASGTTAGTTAGSTAGSTTGSTTGSTAGTSGTRTESMKSQAMAETYRLTPASSVSLQPHVGHKVEITGTLEQGADTSSTAGTSGTGATASGTAGPPANAKRVEVTAVKHISPTCEPGKQ